MTLDEIAIGRRPDIVAMVERAAARHGVDPITVMAHDRTSHEAYLARCEAMREARATGLSLTAVGRAFGRHHTTVLAAVRRVS